MTLDQEINHIWAKKWSLSTVIFVVNRYVALGLAILAVLSDQSYAVSIALYNVFIHVSVILI